MMRLNENDRQWIIDNTETDDQSNALISYLERNFERKVKYAKLKARAKELLERIDSRNADGNIKMENIIDRCVELRNEMRRDREDVVELGEGIIDKSIVRKVLKAEARVLYDIRKDGMTPDEVSEKDFLNEVWARIKR
jgi:hypothetical protein